jgi:hypothetical protein
MFPYNIIDTVSKNITEALYLQGRRFTYLLFETFLVLRIQKSHKKQTLFF